MTNNFNKIEIKVTDLILWDENARFPDNYAESSEQELIEYFISKKTFEIENFVEEIAKDIDLPQLEKIVVWQDDGNLVVLEGNRRLTCYKILINPDLINNKYKKLKSRVLQLKSEVNLDDSFKLECLSSDVKDDCFRYLDRKHNKRNNEVGWNEPERINYAIRRGAESQNAKLKIAITNFVKQLDFPDELKSKVLGKGYVTTFYRFVATGPAKKTFGLSVNKNGILEYKDNLFPDKLKVIIHNVLKKKDFSGNTVDSRELNKNPEISKYLKEVKSEDISKVDKDIEQNKKLDLFGEKSTDLGKPEKNPKTPKTPRTQKVIDDLFGGDLRLKKGDANDIYRDIIDLYKFYISKKDTLSKSFPSLIRMALRLLVESATEDNQSIMDYVKQNFDSAKKVLSKNHKTTLSNNSINGQKALIQLLQSGAHNYSNSANFEQTIAMSIIIGEMLKITHNKK